MAFRSLLRRRAVGRRRAGVRRRRCARCAGSASSRAGDRVSARRAPARDRSPTSSLDAFRAIFDRDRRGVFPRALARAAAPPRAAPRAATSTRARAARRARPRRALPPRSCTAGCAGRARSTARRRSRRVRADATTRRDAGAGSTADALWRAHDGSAPSAIGGVLAGQTRAWVGARLGVGFYRAGGYAVGFAFRPDRGVLDDRVALPKLRGQLVDAHAVDRRRPRVAVARHRRPPSIAMRRDRPRRPNVHRDRHRSTRRGSPASPAPCAAGPHLFVPTDDGVARVEVVQRRRSRRPACSPRPRRSSPPATASLFTPAASTRSASRDAIRMHLT